MRGHGRGRTTCSFRNGLFLTSWSPVVVVVSVSLGRIVVDFLLLTLGHSFELAQRCSAPVGCTSKWNHMLESLFTRMWPSWARFGRQSVSPVGAFHVELGRLVEVSDLVVGLETIWFMEASSSFDVVGCTCLPWIELHTLEQFFRRWLAPSRVSDPSVSSSARRLRKIRKDLR